MFDHVMTTSELHEQGFTIVSDLHLQAPENHTLETTAIETFEALIGPMVNTCLETEIETISHGLASLLNRRTKFLADAVDKQAKTIQGLIRCADGSEVLETQLETATATHRQLRETHLAMETIAEQMAHCYEAQTGKAFLPAAGGRTSKTAHLTGAVFEAKELLEATNKEQSERMKLQEGCPIAVAGNPDWTDVNLIWSKLDTTRKHMRAKYGQDLILFHKGHKKGVDAIAAAWARKRKVPQVIFAPNWTAHGKSAGFKAVDQMFTAQQKLQGVIVFGSNGIALNLAQKAEKPDIKALYVDAPNTATA